MADSIINTPVVPGVDRTEAAFLTCLPTINMVQETELLPVTLDVMSMATSIVGALPELRALRPQIEKTWRDYDFTGFDKLGDYALALVHAHGNHNRLSAPKADVSVLAAELTRMRDFLFGVASPLVAVGLLGNTALEKCKVAVGYRPLIGDVITLVNLYRDNWSALEGKVVVTQEQLLRAKNLALELMEQLGLKEQSPVTVGDAALIRQKAFTLVVRTYERARRAVLYLRADQGDADEIAPSLYALRTGKRRVNEEEVAPVAVTENGTPKPAGVAPVASAPAFVMDNTAGLPMGNPFTN